MRYSTYTNLAFFAWLAIGVVWLIGRFGTKKTIARPDMSKQIFVSILIGIGAILIYFPRLPEPLLARLTPTSGPFPLLGLALCFISALFAIWARLALGRNWSGAMPTLKENHALVTNGPYRYVRHPIYTGFLFAALGTAMTMGTLGSYLGTLCMGAAFLMRIPTEEGIMTSQFPTDYPAYKKRVKMLIPFVW